MQFLDYQKTYNLSWVAKLKNNLENGHTAYIEKKRMQTQKYNSELSESKSGQISDFQNPLKSGKLSTAGQCGLKVSLPF